jgi:hypothetical protein
MRSENGAVAAYRAFAIKRPLDQYGCGFMCHEMILHRGARKISRGDESLENISYDGRKIVLAPQNLRP